MGHHCFLPSDQIWRTKKTIFNGKENHHIPIQKLLKENIMLRLDQIGVAHFGKGAKRRKHGPWVKLDHEKYLLQSALLVISTT